MAAVARLIVSFTFCWLLLTVAASAQHEQKLEKLPEVVRGIFEEKLPFLFGERAEYGKGDGKGERETGLAVAPNISDQAISDGERAESELHAAINPADSNNIIVSPIRYNLSGGISCPIYYTKDFGVTWHESAFENAPRFGSGVAVGGGDPVLAFDADGTAYVTWISLFTGVGGDSTYWGIFWASSTDGGVTWDRPENDVISIYSAPGPYPVSLFSLPMIVDKEWIAADHSATARRNSVYVAFVQMTLDGRAPVILLYRKRPGQNAFDPTPVPISDASFSLVQFSNVDVDADGDVHVTFFGTKTGGGRPSVWHVRVEDGETAGAPTWVADAYMSRFVQGGQADSIVGISRSRLYPCPSLAADRSNGPTRGNLYLSWTASGTTAAGRDGMDIYISRSTDRGATWSTAAVVNDDQKGRVREQHYSSVSVNDHGVLAVTWYDRRNDAAHRLGNYYMAYSFDGGQTFTENFPVSTEATDFRFVGGRNGGFGVGEYTQVVTSSGYAIPFWADGRGANGALQIYGAFVPIVRTPSGVGDHRAESVTGTCRLLEPRVEGDAMTVGIELLIRSHVRIDLHDAAGATVATIADGTYEPGERTFRLATGSLASGSYFLVLRTESGSITKAVVLSR